VAGTLVPMTAARLLLLLFLTSPSSLSLPPQSIA